MKVGAERAGLEYPALLPLLNCEGSCRGYRDTIWEIQEIDMNGFVGELGEFPFR